MSRYLPGMTVVIKRRPLTGRGRLERAIGEDKWWMRLDGGRMVLVSEDQIMPAA